MKADFYALFKRGRYSRPAHSLGPDDGSQVGVTRAMQEAERFAAAAIAFTWRHDAQFRNHFWKSVCRFDGDPELTEKAEILVEPYRWADLLITDRTEEKSLVYVLELKINGGLEDIQNPANEQFDLPEGYGGLIRSSFAPSDHSLHYVLLGAKHLDLGTQRQPFSIRVQQRGWKDLAEHFPTSSIANDLKLFLGMLGIGAFPAAEVKNMKVDTRLREFAKAASILREVKRRLEWPDHRQEQPSIGYSNGNWYLGVELLISDAEPAKSLKLLVNPPWKNLAWFGYQGEDGGTPSLGVWLYCGRGLY